MHASLHELLTLRDEVPRDTALDTHVRECHECRSELLRLRAVTAEMRGLESQGTPPDRWPAIQAALQRWEKTQDAALPPPHRESTKKHPAWTWSMAAAAAVVASVVLLTWQRDGVYELNEGVVEELPLQTQPQGLIAESRELEQLLATLPQEPAAVRASTALTLANLQDRIDWVDYRLALSEEAGLKPQQAELLWQERVDLLNSLVAVRYAQARTAY